MRFLRFQQRENLAKTKPFRRTAERIDIRSSKKCHCLLNKKHFTLISSTGRYTKWFFIMVAAACGFGPLLASSWDKCGKSGPSQRFPASCADAGEKNSIIAPSKSSLRLVRSTAAVSMSRGQLALALAVRDRVIGHVTLLPSPCPRRCHQQFAAPYCVLRPLTTCTPVGQVVCEPNNE